MGVHSGARSVLRPGTPAHTRVPLRDQAAGIIGTRPTYKMIRLPSS